MEKIKLQTVSRKLLVAAAAISVVMVGISVWHFYNLFAGLSLGTQNQPFYVIGAVVSWLLMLGIYLNTALMLRTVAKERTSFISKVATQIKISAALLFSVEGVQYVLSFVGNTFFPLINHQGEKIATTYSFGGMLIVSAIAIYTMALIVEHGIALQKQSDETL